MKFTPKEIATRVAATFLQGATTGAAMTLFTDIEVAQTALFTGLLSVVTLIHRLSSRWLEQADVG